MSEYNHLKEINEAVHAGQKALYSLREADNYLASARGWGIWDMLGGGFISGLIKHSKLDNAQNCLNRAQSELISFNRELSDVKMYCNTAVSFDGLTKFIDVVCDNFWVDLFVQSRISDCRNSIRNAIVQVENALRQLENEKRGY